MKVAIVRIVDTLTGAVSRVPVHTHTSSGREIEARRKVVAGVFGTVVAVRFRRTLARIAHRNLVGVRTHDGGVAIHTGPSTSTGAAPTRSMSGARCGAGHARGSVIGHHPVGQVTDTDPCYQISVATGFATVFGTIRTRETRGAIAYPRRRAILAQVSLT